MSNKRYKNYTNYSNNAETNKVEEAVAAETTPEVVEEVKVEEAKEPVKETKKTVVGCVANCVKLNVRQKPSMSAEVVTVIGQGDSVEVENASTSGEFYKVSGPDFKGYCVKKFIQISK